METPKRNEALVQPKKEKPKKWLYLVLLFLGILVLLFSGGLLAGYLFFGKGDPKDARTEEVDEFAENPSFLNIYYPAKGRLEMEERRVAVTGKTEERARAVMEEFLKGPAGMEPSYIPRNAKVREVYPGADRMLYVDLSEEFRRNFQGDAVSEFLLLRGIYESLLSNVQETTDVRLLVEGKEVESIGGHILAGLPLGRVVVSTSDNNGGEDNKRDDGGQAEGNE